MYVDLMESVLKKNVIGKISTNQTIELCSIRGTL